MSREFTGLLGTEFVRPASDPDVIDGVRPRLVVEPGTPSEVARVLAAANAAGLKVAPRGGGTKVGWGSPPAAVDLIISLRRLDRVLEHAAGDMTATVEAGCTFASLQRTLAERGQRLALDPLWPERATVGGVLATADSGPLRAAFGPPRDLVLGVTVALADGTLARSGGKVVKNVAGYDLPKLYTGSFGTLGVVTQATFRLHPLPAAARDLGFEIPFGAIGAFTAAMSECSLLTAGVQVRLRGDGQTIACLRIESLPEAIDAKADRVAQAAIAAGATRIDFDASEEWNARERLFDREGGPGVVCKVGFPPARLRDVLDLIRCDVEDARVAGPKGGARGPEANAPIEGMSDETSSVRGHALQDLGPATRAGSGSGRKAWQLVAQTCGVGLLRVDAPHDERLIDAISRLRSDVVALGGSLVVLHCEQNLKSRLDIWGEPGDALPLMRRVKQQFDPAGTLNPGRFAGRI